MNLIVITVINGVDDGRTHHIDLSALENKTIRIGRGSSSHVLLTNDASVSREHAALTYQQGKWTLTDNQSKNGTFIEGQTPLDRDQAVSGTIPIEPGALFRTGQTWLRFEVMEWNHA